MEKNSKVYIRYVRFILCSLSTIFSIYLSTSICFRIFILFYLPLSVNFSSSILTLSLFFSLTLSAIFLYLCLSFTLFLSPFYFLFSLFSSQLLTHSLLSSQMDRKTEIGTTRRFLCIIAIYSLEQSQNLNTLFLQYFHLFKRDRMKLYPKRRAS